MPAIYFEIKTGNAVNAAPRFLSGDFFRGETLVPIPNTTVKPLEPMIVLKGAKVGYRRDLSRGPQLEKAAGCVAF